MKRDTRPQSSSLSRCSIPAIEQPHGAPERHIPIEVASVNVTTERLVQMGKQRLIPPDEVWNIAPDMMERLAHTWKTLKPAVRKAHPTLAEAPDMNGDLRLTIKDFHGWITLDCSDLKILEPEHALELAKDPSAEDIAYFLSKAEGTSDLEGLDAEESEAKARCSILIERRGLLNGLDEKILRLVRIGKMDVVLFTGRFQPGGTAQGSVSIVFSEIPTLLVEPHGARCYFRDREMEFLVQTIRNPVAERCEGLCYVQMPRPGRRGRIVAMPQELIANAWRVKYEAIVTKIDAALDQHDYTELAYYAPWARLMEHYKRQQERGTRQAALEEQSSADEEEDEDDEGDPEETGSAMEDTRIFN